MKKFSYDTKKYDFKGILEKVYGCDLSKLHQYLGTYDVFERANDQSTLAHKVFYSNFPGDFRSKYINFMREVIKPIINEDFYYQRIPTFRVGLPGNKFVGEYHKDSHYNHQSYEINFNLGLSGYEGKAALQTQIHKDSEEFTTLECPYGNIFSFDHIDCLHGSDENPNNVTMVSIDFRIALKSLYFENDMASVNLKSRFIPGEYFSSEVA